MLAGQLVTEAHQYGKLDKNGNLGKLLTDFFFNQFIINFLSDNAGHFRVTDPLAESLIKHLGMYW